LYKRFSLNFEGTTLIKFVEVIVNEAHAIQMYGVKETIGGTCSKAE